MDTHAIVWYLANDPRLSKKAEDAMDLATAAGDRIHVLSICLVELKYLVEKGKLPSVARQRLIRALDDSNAACHLAPLDRAVADALESVDRASVPDLPDRIVTATAIALGVPLISRDGKNPGFEGSNDLVARCPRARTVASFTSLGRSDRQESIYY